MIARATVIQRMSRGSRLRASLRAISHRPRAVWSLRSPKARRAYERVRKCWQCSRSPTTLLVFWNRCSSSGGLYANESFSCTAACRAIQHACSVFLDFLGIFDQGFCPGPRADPFFGDNHGYLGCNEFRQRQSMRHCTLRQLPIYWNESMLVHAPTSRLCELMTLRWVWECYVEAIALGIVRRPLPTN